MPDANWFTHNPQSVEVVILASKWSNFRKGFPLMRDEAWSQRVDKLKPIWKQKWMANGIYELIMLSKVTIIAKPELLTTTLIFWNNKTNTFDFGLKLGRNGFYVSYSPRHGSSLWVEAFRQVRGHHPQLVFTLLPDCCKVRRI